ncbi:dephospho-CoA kinase [bacterium]|nr:dephospho-CoA kinase [bacterium]
MSAIRVGVTGNTGAGKTTAAAILGEWGAAVVEADAIGHELLAPGGTLFDRIVEEYGREILSPDGNIDRGVLGGKVLAGPQERERYNRLIHPALLTELLRRVEELGRRHEVVVVDAALLFEWGLFGAMDVIVVVAAPEGLRRERIGARDGPRGQSFALREAAQWPEEKKRAAADFVVENTGDISELRTSLEQIWRNIRGTGTHRERV